MTIEQILNMATLTMKYKRFVKKKIGKKKIDCARDVIF